jgi:hypothetical protein
MIGELEVIWILARSAWVRVEIILSNLCCPGQEQRCTQLQRITLETGRYADALTSYASLSNLRRFPVKVS